MSAVVFPGCFFKFTFLYSVSSVGLAHEGCCNPSGRREGSALGTLRCIVGRLTQHHSASVGIDYTFGYVFSGLHSFLSMQSPWVVGLCLLHLGPKPWDTIGPSL